jgi:hypothetical protein
MGQIPGKASLDASLDATMLVSFAAISPVLTGVGHLRRALVYGGAAYDADGYTHSLGA